MSLQHAISKVKNPISTGGSYRTAYYSKKYDVVIKKPLNSYGYSDNIYEWKLFSQMTKDEKKFFPVIDLMYDNKQQPCLIMNKVNCSLGYTIGQLMRKYNHNVLNSLCFNNFLQLMDELEKDFNIETYAEELYNVIKKYEIKDLHYNNIGIYKNQLVIIDFALTDSDVFGSD